MIAHFEEQKALQSGAEAARAAREEAERNAPSVAVVPLTAAEMERRAGKDTFRLLDRSTDPETAKALEPASAGANPAAELRKHVQRGSAPERMQGSFRRSDRSGCTAAR